MPLPGCAVRDLVLSRQWKPLALRYRTRLKPKHQHWVREQRRQHYTRTSHLYVEVLNAHRDCADALRKGREELASERLAAAARAVTDLQLARLRTFR